MTAVRAAAGGGAPLSHNLVGQRLGAKGRGTRARIIAAAERLLAAGEAAPLSLSAVAREAALGLSSLYLYFADLSELLLAVLEPITAEAEAGYVAQLRRRWPDATLAAEARTFLDAFHGFWERHTRVLHLRNSLADAQDERMLRHRIRVSLPLIRLIVRQMDGDPAAGGPAVTMATVLLTGIERVVTVTTDLVLVGPPDAGRGAHVHGLLDAEARLLAFGIGEERRRSAAGYAR